MDKETQDKQDVFNIWKQNVGLRISNWKKTLSSENKRILANYSVASLEHLERYILSNYNLVALRNTDFNPELDACVSYIGAAILGIMKDSKWHIYLDDTSNVDYGLPVVLTKYSGPISVHFLLREILSNNTGQVLKTRLDKVIAYDKKMRELIKNIPQSDL